MPKKKHNRHKSPAEAITDCMVENAISKKRVLDLDIDSNNRWQMEKEKAREQDHDYLVKEKRIDSMEDILSDHRKSLPRYNMRTPAPPEAIVVDCICGSKKDEEIPGHKWVQCDVCNYWQHSDCVGYTPEEKNRDAPYYCECCDVFKLRVRPTPEQAAQLMADKIKRLAVKESDGENESKQVITSSPNKVKRKRPRRSSSILISSASTIKQKNNRRFSIVTPSAKRGCPPKILKERYVDSRKQTAYRSKRSIDKCLGLEINELSAKKKRSCRLSEVEKLGSCVNYDNKRENKPLEDHSKKILEQFKNAPGTKRSVSQKSIKMQNAIVENKDISVLKTIVSAITSERPKQEDNNKEATGSLANMNRKKVISERWKQDMNKSIQKSKQLEVKEESGDTSTIGYKDIQKSILLLTKEVKADYFELPKDPEYEKILANKSSLALPEPRIKNETKEKANEHAAENARSRLEEASTKCEVTKEKRGRRLSIEDYQQMKKDDESVPELEEREKRPGFIPSLENVQPTTLPDLQLKMTTIKGNNDSEAELAAYCFGTPQLPALPIRAQSVRNNRKDFESDKEFFDAERERERQKGSMSISARLDRHFGKERRW